MEANFFRFVADELKEKFSGSRIGKIFSPARELWSIDLGRGGYLILRSSRKGGFFFLSPQKPENPLNPSAKVMWLRKQLKNRRILKVKNIWTKRRLYLELSPGPFKYLLLDLCQGLALVQEVCDDENVYWPSLEEIFSRKDIWKEYPQISPPLRKILAQLDPEESKKLYARIMSGQVNEFYLHHRDGQNLNVLCWRLKDTPAVSFSSASEAAYVFGFPRVSELVNQVFEKQKENRNKIKRIRRRLEKLEQDEQRLKNMVAEKQKALLIQANLYRLEARAKEKQVSVIDMEGKRISLSLDSSLSIKENMERIFARAAKGERGLKFIEQRRRQLIQELDEVQKIGGQKIEKKKKEEVKPIVLSRKLQKLKVCVYRSSEGFIILRGKNKEANHKLLSFGASSFDLWFHAQGGPGAHVILKRDYQDQEVPEKSILEAAALAGLFSYQKDAGQAKVICALVKDVRKVKGFELGQVVVDKVLKTMVVPLEPGLEDRLKVDV
ncbi:DUF814 domain-containing protein [Desulfohalobiaceae bacterium Ax17]|uniref:NFACT RNA binding domain-containing protein n=1 Tax=Desulfovulcanus ferrireducens TaxID=2831190 RepID=UPI00207BB9CB|nr:NFACT RNA binding domain-containing protein [Desulfovulcanus ferrireducens]MBT8762650.1 DUF814 domain-containing protein [Desulfovulcanus ferrireducens]